VKYSDNRTYAINEHDGHVVTPGQSGRVIYIRKQQMALLSISGRRRAFFPVKDAFTLFSQQVVQGYPRRPMDVNGMLYIHGITFGCTMRIAWVTVQYSPVKL
jgi:hypothetical protein